MHQSRLKPSSLVAWQRELQLQPLGVVVSRSGEPLPDLMNLAFLAAVSNGQPIWKIWKNYENDGLKLWVLSQAKITVATLDLNYYWQKPGFSTVKLCDKELLGHPKIVPYRQMFLILMKEIDKWSLKWFLNNNLFLVKTFLTTKFDCIWKLRQK